MTSHSSRRRSDYPDLALFCQSSAAGGEKRKNNLVKEINTWLIQRTNFIRVFLLNAALGL